MGSDGNYKYKRIKEDGSIADRLWKRFNNIRNKILESEDKFELGFVKQSEVSIELTNLCSNQIIVLFKNGRYEVLPYKIYGSLVKDYLGVHYTKILSWSLLPALGSENNPLNKKESAKYLTTDRDIYNCK